MRTSITLLCAAILLAGCGGDDDETTVVETTTVTETETVPPPPGEGTTTSAEPEPEDDAAEDEGTREDGAAEAPSDCGQIAFEPNTDSGAFGIQAIRTDCATARGVARAAEGRGDDLVYEARGFTCNGTRNDDQPLPQVEWLCIGAGREVVSFVTS